MNDLDRLKPLAEIAVVDPRSQGTMSFFDISTGIQQNHTLTKHHEEISRLQLATGVPEDIAVSFEVARNLYLYSFYVYRFGVVACTQAFQTLEYALRERAKTEGVSVKPAGLASHLKIAVDKGWLSDRAFDRMGINPALPKNEYSKTLSKTLPGMRNILAHGSFTLFPPHEAFHQLEICASIINCVLGDKPCPVV